MTQKLPHQAGSRQEAVELMAMLAPEDAEQYRTMVAKEWNLRTSMLDQMVSKRRAELNPEPEEASTGWNVEPAADAVNGAALFREIEETITKHVIIPKGAAAAMALWIGHTYTIDIARHTPLLAILSPQPECGKTRTMTVLLHLCKNPLPMANVSPAAIYYAIKETNFPTLLMDELDSQPDGGEACRNILNSGHERKFAYVKRTEEIDGERRLVDFCTFCPKVVGSIDKLKPTLMSRAIIVWLRRKAPEETIADIEDSEPYLATIPPKLLRWATDNIGALKATKPKLPPSLANRGADNWRELFRIAEVLGGGWPEMLAASVTSLVGARGEDNSTTASLLLEDMKGIFESEGEDVLSSNTICAKLAEMEGRSWPEHKNGKPITPQQMAAILKPFEVVPGQHWTRDDRNIRGYSLADPKLQQAFALYIRPSPEKDARAARSLEPAENRAPIRASNGHSSDLAPLAASPKVPDVQQPYRRLDDDEFPTSGKSRLS